MQYASSDGSRGRPGGTGGTGGTGVPAPNLFLDQTNKPKKFLLETPPPLSKGLDDRPVPRPLSQALDPALASNHCFVFSLLSIFRP